MKRREIKLYLIIFCCLSSFLVLILIIQNNIYKEREQQYSYMMSVNNHVRCPENRVPQYLQKKKYSKIVNNSYDQSFDQQKFTSFLKEKKWNKAPEVSYSNATTRSSKTSLLTLSTSTHNLNHSSLHIVENTIASTHTQFESIRTHYSSVFTMNDNGSKMQLDYSQQAISKMFTLPGEESGGGPEDPDLPAPLGDYFWFLLLLSSIYLISLKYHNRKSLSK